MARSVGNVDLTMGLVNCPVQMFSISDSHDRKASTYHAHNDGSFGKVKQPKICEGCGEAVAGADIIKGYEEDGQVVMLSADELETVAVNSGSTVEIPQFVKADQVNHMMFAGENAYRLVPDPKRGRAALATYLTIRRELIEQELVGIVQYTRWGRNRLGLLAVEPTEYGGVLVIRNMIWPDELRAPAFPVLEKADIADVDPRLQPVAKAVIASMTEDWNPESYTDTYTDALNAAIAAKVSGDEIATVATESDGAIDDVSDLLAKLEASAKAKAETKKPAAKKRSKKEAAA
jgi:DNA end-binding protein Ku